MPNYLAKFEHTTRSIDRVVTYRGIEEFNHSKSAKQVRDNLYERAHKNKLEDFKVLSVDKYKCLECCDTGQSRYNGCACC